MVFGSDQKAEGRIMRALILSDRTNGNDLPCGVESSLLLPVLNRPAIWHLMSMIKDWGISGVTFGPEQPEELLAPILANGDRWGVTIDFPGNIETIIPSRDMIDNTTNMTDDPTDEVTDGGTEDNKWLVVAPGWVGLGIMPEFPSHKEKKNRQVLVHCSEDDRSETGLWVLSEESLKEVLSGNNEDNGSLSCDKFRNLLLKADLERVETTSFLIQGMVNTIDDFLKTNLEALKGLLPLMSGDTTEISPGILIGSGTTIDPTAELTGPLYVGNGCVVSAGAVLSGSIIGDGTAIGRDCVINNAIIDENTFVGNMTEVVKAYASKCRLHRGGNCEWLIIEDPFLLSNINIPMDMSLKEIVKGVFDLAKDHFSPSN